MADYQLRARIPHELADEIKELVDYVNERFPGVEATFSTVSRQALQEFVRRSSFGEKRIISLELPMKDLNSEQLETVRQGLELISTVFTEAKEAESKVQDRIEWLEFEAWKRNGKLPKGVDAE